MHEKNTRGHNHDTPSTKGKYCVNIHMIELSFQKICEDKKNHEHEITLIIKEYSSRRTCKEKNASHELKSSQVFYLPKKKKKSLKFFTYAHGLNKPIIIIIIIKHPH